MSSDIARLGMMLNQIRRCLSPHSEVYAKIPERLRLGWLMCQAASLRGFRALLQSPRSSYVGILPLNFDLLADAQETL